MKHLVIFDIDGTLVDSNKADADAFCQALQEVFSIQHVDADWYTYKHSTDAGIFEEIIEKHYQRKPTVYDIDQMKQMFVDRLQKQTFESIPGAKQIDNILQSSKAHYVAIATGGWQMSAAYKLQAVDVLTSVPLASSDDHYDRKCILEVATERAKNEYQIEHFNTITYVGDKAWDFRAANELGYEFIGIGDCPKLKEETFDKRLPDYLDAKRFMEFVAVA